MEIIIMVVPIFVVMFYSCSSWSDNVFVFTSNEQVRNLFFISFAIIVKILFVENRPKRINSAFTNLIIQIIAMINIISNIAIVSALFGAGIN
jgi:hypothetical protein